MKLSDYDMSRERGFLSAYEIDDIALPAHFDAVRAAAANLSNLITTGRVRHWLEQLEDPQIADWLKSGYTEGAKRAEGDLGAEGTQGTEGVFGAEGLQGAEGEVDAQDAQGAQIRTLMVHYSFLVQAYVWGEAEPPAQLPANLSRPIVALADHLGLPPLLPYSAYVLNNWMRIDKSGPITLENIAMYQNFAGGDDENWFVTIHVAIEAEAGVLLDNGCALIDVCKAGDAAEAERLLREMDEAWEKIYSVFKRMTERCDPYVYFHRVRPYIHGWANNPALNGGLIYEGIDEYAGQPQALRGQTGSQSSIVPAMDALFAVSHSEDPLKSFLDELHQYRPPKHRQLIEDFAAQSTLRAFVETSSSPGLKAAFNACVEQVARFRTRHLEYAASYINKQAGSIAGNDPDVGTGGTPFMKYLKKHRDENREQVVELGFS